jgi:RNA polymerase sigma-70 factor (ECF subfamily)
LLIRLRQSDDEAAWSEFVKIYAPLIHAYGLRRGLQDADAADLSQTVLQSIARSVGDFQYDRSKGTFRGWLFTITRNHLLKALQRRHRDVVARGDSSAQDLLKEYPDQVDDESVWNEEHERRLFAWAVNRVRAEYTESTWRAFWMSAVEGVRAAEIAEQLRMSVGAVYIAKSRVTARIRDVIQSIED